MRYVSTRGGHLPPVSFETALLSAYAADGGLFVPEMMPSYTAELRGWSGLSLAEVTGHVMAKFTDLPLAMCQQFAGTAFKSFNGGNEPPLPLRRVGKHVLLETGNGPTLAFKDIGQQVVAQLLNHYLGQRGRRANIVVETSGDTGPAAIAGVRGCEHVTIFCLYPHGRISEVQELQMITEQARNVHVYRTEGDTDEQAEALKLLFSDAEFMSRHQVCSINSINWARIMVQSAYYAWAYLQLRPAADGPVNFVIPSGAFGNAMGGYLAKLMGLPIGRIVCATNANDIVHRTLATGDLSMAENRETVSPAMDIQFAYNLERMLYFASGRDAPKVAALMRTLEASRAARLDRPLLAAVHSTFASVRVGDADTIGTMAAVYREHGYALCPHSAVGVFAAEQPQVLEAIPDAPVVCVLTAHPAKFDAAVAAAGMPRQSTPAVDALRQLPHRFEWLRAPKGLPPAEKRALWAATVREAVERANAPRAKL